jgi:hypothetical protein
VRERERETEMEKTVWWKDTKNDNNGRKNILSPNTICVTANGHTNFLETKGRI